MQPGLGPPPMTGGALPHRTAMKKIRIGFTRPRRTKTPLSRTPERGGGEREDYWRQPPPERKNESAVFLSNLPRPPDLGMRLHAESCAREMSFFFSFGCNSPSAAVCGLRTQKRDSWAFSREPPCPLPAMISVMTAQVRSQPEGSRPVGCNDRRWRPPRSAGYALFISSPCDARPRPPPSRGGSASTHRRPRRIGPPCGSSCRPPRRRWPWCRT